MCAIAGNAEVVALIGVFVAAAVLIALEVVVLIALVAVLIAPVAALIALQIAFEHPAPFERQYHRLKVGFRQ